MKIRLNVYSVSDASSSRALGIECSAEIKRWGCWAFEVGSLRERYFLHRSKELGVVPAKRMVFLVDDRGVKSIPFVFLRVRKMSEPLALFGNYRGKLEYFGQFFNVFDACTTDLETDGYRSGRETICMSGIRQIKKVVMAPVFMKKKMDIGMMPFAHNVYIVSKEFKRI